MDKTLKDYGKIKWPTGFNKEDFVRNGNYGAVYLDSLSSIVVKFPYKGCEEAIRIEIKIYKRFEQYSGYQIAYALAFVYSTGVIHGDLHSGNIFLDGDLNAKVGDFAGSSLDGSPLLIATPYNRLPDKEIKDLIKKLKFSKTKGRLGPIRDIITGCW
ncbi:kinase-like protein [Cenococcum geophilum]